jgi:hypothetical protein
MMKQTKKLVCDYLVIGSGASPLAFVDTLLTELPKAKVVMIDKKAVPGGHWVDAYDFVRLHQPSIVYGVASRQLEGNWLKLMATRLTLPWNHRATKQELLSYFGSFVDEKVKSGQLEFYPNCVYDFDNNASSDAIHHFKSNDGTINYEVTVNHKLVNGVAGESIIPSREFSNCSDTSKCQYIVFTINAPHAYILHYTVILSFFRKSFAIPRR